MCSGKVCSAIKSCQLPIQPWSVHGALSIKMANYCFLWVSLSQEAQLSFQSTGFLSCLLCLHPSPLPRLPCPLSLWKLPWVHNIVGKEGKKRERGRREGPSEHPRAPEGKEWISGAAGQGHFLMQDVEKTWASHSDPNVLPTTEGAQCTDWTKIT